MHITIERSGLVTSVGLSAESSCAAIRAKLTNPLETRFADSGGKWLMGHEAPLERPWRGLDKLVRMAVMAIDECLADMPAASWNEIPLLLCVAETDRPGRLPGLDDRLFSEIESSLGVRFAAGSAVIAHGRVSTAVALAAADKLLSGGKCKRVIVAAADSLLHWPTLSVHDRAGRLLNDRNSNGYMPGEAAGAVMLSPPTDGDVVAGPRLHCTGTGFAVEKAHLESGEPLRADGLAAAIRQALDDASQTMRDIDFRVADLSGEQYYFKEAALALSRTLQRPKEAFDLWHPAESIGETGAASGLAMLAVVEAACRKAYAPGPRILLHFANDGGQRAAVTLQWGGQP